MFFRLYNAIVWYSEESLNDPFSNYMYIKCTTYSASWYSVSVFVFNPRNAPNILNSFTTFDLILGYPNTSGLTRYLTGYIQSSGAPNLTLSSWIGTVIVILVLFLVYKVSAVRSITGSQSNVPAFDSHWERWCPDSIFDYHRATYSLFGETVNQVLGYPCLIPNTLKY